MAAAYGAYLLVVGLWILIGSSDTGYLIFFTLLFSPLVEETCRTAAASFIISRTATAITTSATVAFAIGYASLEGGLKVIDALVLTGLAPESRLLALGFVFVPIALHLALGTIALVLTSARIKPTAVFGVIFLLHLSHNAADELIPTQAGLMQVMVDGVRIIVFLAVSMAVTAWARSAGHILVQDAKRDAS